MLRFATQSRLAPPVKKVALAWPTPLRNPTQPRRTTSGNGVSCCARHQGTPYDFVGVARPSFRKVASTPSVGYSENYLSRRRGVFAGVTPTVFWRSISQRNARPDSRLCV